MEAEVEETVEIDEEIPRDMLTMKILDIVKTFAPFGQEHPPLAFLVRGLRVLDITFMGKEQNHLRLTLDAGASKWPAVYWNAADRVNVAFAQGETVDAVFNAGTNFYQGNETPQLTLLDLKRSSDREA